MVTNIFLSFYAVVLMILFVIGPMIKAVYADIEKVPKGIVIPLGVIVVATPIVALAHIFYFIWR